MAYPEDYPDDLTKAKAQGYLRRHMVVDVDPATGLPVGGGSLPGDDLSVARAQGYLHRHMAVRADPATGLPVGGGSLTGDDLAVAKAQGYLNRHMVVDADPTTGLPVGGGASPGDDLSVARAQGYLHRHMIVWADPLTGLPVGGGALPGDDLVQARTQGYLHRHMVVTVDPVTGLPGPIVPPVYVANGVDFNEATPDYLTRASDLNGNTEGYTGTLSFWVRRDGAANEDMVIANQSNTFRARFLSTGNFAIQLQNDVATHQLVFTSTPTYAASPVWRWFGASWNTNFAAGLKVFHLWNDTGLVATSKTDASTAFLVDYTRLGWAVAAQYGAGFPLNGCLAEVFFTPNQFIDFSVLANREKFIKDGKPVNLGADGSLPLSAVPLVYLRNPAPTAHINSGSGGDFTIVGAPAVASFGPSDPPLVQNYFDRMTVAPSGAVQTAITTFLNGLWTDGVLQKIDAAWIMNLHTEQASRLNVMGSDYTLTDVGAAPVWATGVGGAGGFTAAGAALSTGFSILANGRNMVQNSAHISLRSRTSAVSAAHDVGHSGSFFNTRFTGDALIGRINGAANDSEANPDGAGFFAIERATAADCRFYRAGLPLTLETEASVAPSASPLYVCGIFPSSVSSRRQTFVSIGGSLGDAGQAALNTRLATFEAAIGAT